MIYKVVRTSITLLFALMLAIPSQATAQDKTDSKSKKKNSDVDNIGNRNINKGSINFISLEKEIAMGR